MSNDRIRLADRVQYRVARLLACLSPAMQLRLSGEPPVVVDGQTLDANLQMLRALRRRRRAPALVEPDHVTARARFRREMRAMAGPREPVAAVRHLSIAGPAGPIALRHYRPPTGDAPQPLLVYLHGGGFVIGDLDTHDPACRLLCVHAGVHVLSVDYRLAPEHPFPVPLDDAAAAFAWAHANAASLGADPGRVAIGGDSAGGNLAAVVAQQAPAGARPVAQLLIYPTTDALTPRASHALFGASYSDGGYFLSNADRAAFSRLYTGAASEWSADRRVSPLRAASLAGLPPALVAVAGFDVLRDEGDAYAASLAAARVDVTLLRFTALGHGFVNMTAVTPAARRATIALAAEFRALLDGRSRPRTLNVP